MTLSNSICLRLLEAPEGRALFSVCSCCVGVCCEVFFSNQLFITNVLVLVSTKNQNTVAHTPCTSGQVNNWRRPMERWKYEL